MATTITAARSTAHLDIVWAEDASVLADLFRAAEGREVTLVRLGTTPVMRCDGDAVHYDERLITDRGVVSHVRLSPCGRSISLYVGGVPTFLTGRHPMSGATRFALTVR